MEFLYNMLPRLEQTSDWSGHNWSNLINPAGWKKSSYPASPHQDRWDCKKKYPAYTSIWRLHSWIGEKLICPDPNPRPMSLPHHYPMATSNRKVNLPPRLILHSLVPFGLHQC